MRTVKVKAVGSAKRGRGVPGPCAGQGTVLSQEPALSHPEASLNSSARWSLVLWTGCLCLPKFIGWSSNSQCDYIWMGGGLWQVTGFRWVLTVVLIDGISGPELPATPAVWRHSKKKAVCKPGNGLTPDAESADTLILEAPASRKERGKCLLLSYPVSGVLQQPSQTRLLGHEERLRSGEPIIVFKHKERLNWA